MNLEELFSAVLRIADASERIAAALEMNALEQPVQPREPREQAQPSEEGADRPKRHRRTKAEMEAARAAEAAVTVTVVDTPPTAPAGAVSPMGSSQTAVWNGDGTATITSPVSASLVGMPGASGVQPAPVAPPAPAPVQDELGNYMSMPVEGQFTVLNGLVVPYFQQPAVRDAIVNTAAQYGLGLPFSDPTDRTIPGAAYRNADPNARYAIYAAALRAVNAAKAASL